MLAYLDDVIILCKFRGGTILRASNLKLKAKKCELFQKEVLFLGRVVSHKGVSANPQSVAKVLGWPVPLSPKEPERFLGLVNYHRAHIRQFA